MSVANVIKFPSERKSLEKEPWNLLDKIIEGGENAKSAIRKLERFPYLFSSVAEQALDFLVGVVNFNSSNRNLWLTLYRVLGVDHNNSAFRFIDCYINEFSDPLLNTLLNPHAIDIERYIKERKSFFLSLGDNDAYKRVLFQTLNIINAYFNHSYNNIGLWQCYRSIMNGDIKSAQTVLENLEGKGEALKLVYEILALEKEPEAIAIHLNQALDEDYLKALIVYVLSLASLILKHHIPESQREVFNIHMRLVKGEIEEKEARELLEKLKTD